MKKVFNILLICFLIITLQFFGCSKNNENNVIIFLDNGQTARSYTLTSRTAGSTIYTPEDYKIFPAILGEYVLIDEIWYSNNNYTNQVFFPATMPNENLNLYAKIRPLTKISDINFADTQTVQEYFASQSPLKDDYSNNPNINSETSYYEISEYNSVGINTTLQYYPATKKIKLGRGYSTSDTIANSITIQNSFIAGLSINLIDKSITCKGNYTRTGYSINSISSGTIIITYNINAISIDNPKLPLTPTFSTIKYNYQITDATNYNQIKELWDKEGYNYAKKCYNQINILLKTLNNKIEVFS